MNLPFFIAKRYFLSRKKTNFINVISLISMTLVAMGTFCLIIALSVFNGLEDLLKNMYKDFDPDIIVSASKGKSFTSDPSQIQLILDTEGVLALCEVIEDNVLLRYKNAQSVVRMKGVGSSFESYSGIKNVLVEGEFSLAQDSAHYALLGRGVQYQLSINLNDTFHPLQVYYPKNIDLSSNVSPEKMYRRLNIFPGGVFAIEKHYDENYLFVPLAFAKKLLQYEDRRTGYEIYVKDPDSVKKIINALTTILGSNFEVMAAEEMHSDLFRILKIEKLFVFLVLTAIIAIASVNIFFTLTMLVIEKKKDISVMIAQGASARLIRSIFLTEGCIVAFSGAFIGLTLGIALGLIQQEYGIIKMGLGAAVLKSYPIKIALPDVVLTTSAVILITLFASIQPAIKAGKSFSMQEV